eukprot:SAG25_NODE_14564_length_253_cov_0.675325_1_plen_36_part_10
MYGPSAKLQVRLGFQRSLVPGTQRDVVRLGACPQHP